MLCYFYDTLVALGLIVFATYTLIETKQTVTNCDTMWLMFDLTKRRQNLIAAQYSHHSHDISQLRISFNNDT